MKPPTKTHLIGPMTIGGFFRTLCERDLTSLKATSERELVDCQLCLARMK